jgi:hypothetical protein
VVNDYAIVKATTGTGDHYSHQGCWKVLSVDSATQLTVQNTNRKAAFPTGTVTGGTLIAIKTMLKFTGCLGVVVAPGKALGKLDNVVLVGDINTSEYGLVVGSHIKTSMNIVVPGASSAYLGSNFGVNGFNRSGIWSGYGGSIYALGGSASSNNGDHGWEADCGGHIVTGWSGYAIASGNEGTGFMAYLSGSMWAGNSVVSCGNACGVAAQRGASIMMSGSKSYSNTGEGYKAEGGFLQITVGSEAKYNGTRGYYAVDGGNIYAAAPVAGYNGASGFWATIGGSINTTGAAQSTYNTEDGFYATYGGVIKADGSTSTNNGRIGYYALYSGTISARTTTSSDNVNEEYKASRMSYIDANGAVGAPTYSPALDTEGNNNSIINS